LQRKQRWGDRPATEFQAGNLTLVVFDPSGFGQRTATPNSAPVALQTDDVNAAREALQAKGVTFVVDFMDSGVCHQAIFLDPDGNALILHHRYAPAPTS
jgi:predicted enzyme related to lactoylglutathione lyase